MKMLLAALLLLALAACAASPQLPYQYATLKLIESEHVTADQVIESADRISALLSEDYGLTSQEITENVRSIVGYSALAPSDRLLVDALLADAMASLPYEVATEPGSHVVLGEDSYALLLQRLEWITQAAAMSD